MSPVADALAEASTSRVAEDFARLLAECKRRPRPAVHSFHRWFGKLIPAIPAAAIEAFTQPGDLVVDPFCGSGTTLVEARVAGRASRGHDVVALATLLSRVKTRAIQPQRLEAAALRVLQRFHDDPGKAWRNRAPDLPNFDHYYPVSVARDLVRLFAAAREERRIDLREWFLALTSGVNRDVSNADTRHVFAGVSKRMRALIAEGWVGDVPARFQRALRDRLAWSRELYEAARDSPPAEVVDAPAEAIREVAGRAALLVTNPPYVSSIRYVETFKLEAYWLGLVRKREDLVDLDRRTLGTERSASKAPLADDEIDAVPSTHCREVVANLSRRDEHVMARVVATYAAGLARALAASAAALRPGGHAVVKLAPSRVRGTTVPTPAACTELFARHGVELLAAVDDAYVPTSRSLTTARNWYSGRMDADKLLVFRKARR